MANTYDTSAIPLGSTAPKVLYNNASNFDDAMNSPGPSWVDRLGLRRQTWTGMQVMVSDFLENIGFEATHLTYVDGFPLTVDRPTQLIDRAGLVYKVKTPANFPVELTGTWATDALLLVEMDDSLRSDLAAASGSTLVGYQSALSGAAQRLLSERLGDRISVKDFGAVGDGVTDDYAAMAAAHATGRSIEYPEGTYLCSQRVTAPAPFGFHGAGINKTTVIFSGSTKGFQVTQATSADGIVFDGASIKTNSASTTTVGLLIDGSAQYTGDDTALRIISDRTSYRCRVENVDFRGVTSSDGWGVNLQFKSMINFSAENIVFSGVQPPNPATDPLQGVGILINGNGAVVDFSIRRIWGFYTLYGVLMPDYLEGGHIYDYEMVAVVFGIISRFTAGYSVLPIGICGNLGLHIAQGHLNVLQAGVLLENCNQCHIINQNIYLQTRAVDAPGLCVQITNGNWNNISSIFCNGASATNTQTSNSGVVLTTVGLSSVRDISASALASAVSVQGSSGNDIDGLRAAFCINVIGGDGSSTNNRIGSRRGVSLSGSFISMAAANNFVLDEFAQTFTQAFSSQTSLTIDIGIPAGVFSVTPDFGVMVQDSGSTTFNFQYLYDTSTSTNAKFFVTPQAPAANLGTGTVRLSINLKGR